MLNLLDALIEKLECPQHLKKDLANLIPKENAPLLLLALNRWVNPAEAAAQLKIDEAKVKEEAERLYKQGFMEHEKGSYKTKPLGSILYSVLAIEQVELPDQSRQALSDLGLKLKKEKYENYINEGSLLYAASVKTLHEASSFHRHPHEGTTFVVPTDDAAKVLEKASLRVLVPCSCRLTFQKCSKPLMTCILLNESAADCLNRGFGEKLSMEQSLEILKIAAEASLVHLAVYNLSGPYGLCSCCSCCCYDLQILRQNRPGWIEKAKYRAEDDKDLCNNCGICAEVCSFQARSMDSDHLSYEPAKCYGCGVCVVKCPTDAISLR